MWDDICSAVGRSTHQESRRNGANVPKHYLDAGDIEILQMDCEKFGKLILTMGLHPRLTNYGHFVVSHLMELHRRFGGNIYRFSGQDTEGMVKELRREGKNSQNGGHSGVDAVSSKTISLMRRWKRRIITFMNSFRLSNEDGIIKDTIAFYKKNGHEYISGKKQKNLVKKQRINVECSDLLRDTGDDRLDFIINEAINVIGIEGVEQVLIQDDEEVERDNEFN